MSRLRYLIGDVRDRLDEFEDGSVDLIVTSPPFLALRSYLPGDHPDKHREIGSEATPADFLDTLLDLTAEWRRVLAPHGSICVELGDTYSGSGGAGGDYGTGGMREGQTKFDGSARRAKDRPQDHDGTTTIARVPSDGRPPIRNMNGKIQGGGAGWPLAKSLTGIPTLYPWSLAYGRNLLTGQESPAGQWRIRNVIVWARPNPPVGALGDKFRPATSYITVACVSATRYFDLDAVRVELKEPEAAVRGVSYKGSGAERQPGRGSQWHKANPDGKIIHSNPAGAPPLDWLQEMPDDTDGDWLWRLATQPYPGAHYATYPSALPRRLIEAMCPQRVCTTCGKPSERVVDAPSYTRTDTDKVPARLSMIEGQRVAVGVNQHKQETGANTSVIRQTTTLGWTDCGHDAWRNGHVLDPFAGSGTTLAAALDLGRDATGIDIDERNADLARERCGMFLEVEA